jgi:mRNA-degrading endonuclease RelE of RelBE toxin-antitoxin system
MWKVEVKENVRKKIKKYDNSVQKRFYKTVEKFRRQPLPKEKKHFLVVKDGQYLCELAIDKFRFYYEVRTGLVIINKVEYLGKVVVLRVSGSHKAGSKSHYGRQQKEINSMKKDFKKRIEVVKDKIKNKFFIKKSPNKKK